MLLRHAVIQLFLRQILTDLNQIRCIGLVFSIRIGLIIEMFRELKSFPLDL